MRLTSLAPMLGVRDVKATIAFYTEVLGFSVKGTFGPDPDNPGWCFLDRDGVGLMFNGYEPHDHGDGEEHDHDHPAAPVLTGCLYFYVDDVDALYESLKDVAPLQGEPKNYEWGMREIGLSDPDGYQLVFGQNLQ